MTILKEDTLILTRRGMRAPGSQGIRILWIGLVFLSLALLVLSRLDHSALRTARGEVFDFLSPVLELAHVPLAPVRWVSHQVSEYFTLTDELDQLRRDNQRLRESEWRVKELERKLSDLSALSRVVQDRPEKTLTSRVLANSTGVFVRSVMINSGLQQGVDNGYPAVNSGGVIGRVVDSGAAAARVLLITDYNSRIPVRIGQSQVRALMVGDNSDMPRLAYIANDARLNKGDEVVTSGVGGLFPRGLRIGTLVQKDGQLRVAPHANLDRLEYVRVLFHESPSLELTRDGKSKRRLGPQAAVNGGPGAGRPPAYAGPELR